MLIDPSPSKNPLTKCLTEFSGIFGIVRSEYVFLYPIPSSTRSFTRIALEISTPIEPCPVISLPSLPVVL